MIHPKVPQIPKAGRRSAAGRPLAAVLAVVAASALGGCGSVTSVVSSDGGDGGKNLASFEGTWTLVSGTTTVTCAGVDMPSAVTGNVVWQAGTTSDLLQPANSSASGCDLLANVSGNTAAALPNQTCNKMGTNLTISSYTFVIGPSGATETANGTKTVSTSGVGATCTYSETATYTKSP